MQFETTPKHVYNIHNPTGLKLLTSRDLRLSPINMPRKFMTSLFLCYCSDYLLHIGEER